MEASDAPLIDGDVSHRNDPRKALLLFNRSGPAPLIDLADEAFGRQPVVVTERHHPDAPQDLVCLVDRGTVTATSPLSALEQSLLLVNGDYYRTGGARPTTDAFPDVVTELEDVEFTVEGYPGSNKEKLLFILISRYIEYCALEHGAGTMHATFQRLSRLDDENGTREVYERLAASDVTTHVYGVPDDPSAVDDLALEVHPGTSEVYRRSWLVVFRPPQGATDTDPVALVAVQTGENVWRGVWTSDRSGVQEAAAFIEQRF